MQEEWSEGGVDHLVEIKAGRDDDARSMQKELEALQREVESADEVLEAEYGEGLADKLSANLDDAFVELDAPAEQEGDAAQPLMEQWREDLDADRGVPLGGWGKWRADLHRTEA
jgi:hypothetical protein